MCWQPVYALLLLFSTSVTYAASLLISGDRKRKRLWLTAAIVLNLAILFFYKYYGFAADSITAILTACGLRIDIPGLDVLLPVGISFYIFQALGYSIDVYRGSIRAERDFFTYALFVSFFPQLVAGPIERSTNLLPQFKQDRPFNYRFAISGFKLMLWGYFLKLCLADRAALYADKVFNHLTEHDGYSTLIASLMFTLQIYGDFAGYTFVAIGCARILNFSLQDNFRRPYFAISVTDFWRRWHISLSSWLRDYVYFPLGGSRTTKSKIYRNLLVTFAVSGLWHGANWTFVLWGMLHGIALCVERALGINKSQPTPWGRVVRIIITLIIVNIAWLLFRANTLPDALIALRQIFTPSDFTLADGVSTLYIVAIVALIIFIKEWIEEFRPQWLTTQTITVPTQTTPSPQTTPAPQPIPTAPQSTPTSQQSTPTAPQQSTPTAPQPTPTAQQSSPSPQATPLKSRLFNLWTDYAWPILLIVLISILGYFAGGQFIYFQF